MDDDGYEIAETEEFQERAAELAGSMRRWDEIKETFDLDLRRNPYYAQLIPGTTLYGISVVCIPPLTVFYTVNEERRLIKFIAIREL